MYLRSLVLKGFKSFADRSVLTLEPGITAIVGPNGSGKSNISDAVLWVLGERNARNLRGQAMEDVIFAGSSARKATGVAEVELVLDNSDSTLPVDFEEVSISRRMYRSGESEYLINGTVARRMDVLDILHDSGLGSGTHSIISQGSLDSILRSDASDRRALIEEAAGVLKHKQRKARSERKIERMENHVARVRDVVREVERQLKPLSRKAKKAQTYIELSSELADIKLDLAVDDLRNMQRAWEKCKSEFELLNLEVEEKRKNVDECEVALSELQESLKRDSADTGELSKAYQSLRGAAERIDSTLLIIRDRRRQAARRAEELNIAISSSESKREAALKDMKEAESALNEAKRENERSRLACAELERRASDIAGELEGLTSRLRALEEERASCLSEIEEIKKAQIEHRESRANKIAYLKVLEEQIIEGRAAALTAGADAQEIRKQFEAAQVALSSIEEQEKAASRLVASCVQAREATRAALDDARQSQRLIAAQIEALEEIEKASEQSAGGARMWISSRAQNLSGNIVPLVSAIKAPQDLEQLVETLLDRDVMSLLIDTAADVQRVLDELPEEESGNITFLLRDDGSRSGGHLASDFTGRGFFLVDRLTYASEASGAVMAELGDVVVCDSLADALREHAVNEASYRFVTRAGDIVWPKGKVSVASSVADSQGVLSRVRKIAELKDALRGAETVTFDAVEKAEKAERDLASAQESSLEVSRKLALMRGSVQADEERAKEAEAKYSRLQKDLEVLEARADEAAVEKDESQKNDEECKAKLHDLEVSLVGIEDELQTLEARSEPLRQQKESCSSELSDARLNSAKLEERMVYAERMTLRRREELDEAARQDTENRRILLSKTASTDRLKPLIELFEALSENARERSARANDLVEDAMAASSGLHSSISRAREAAQVAHRAYDEAAERLSENRIESAKLEMRVQAAVESITVDCETPVDVALERPPIDDRYLAEESVQRLTSRIANLGTINPDAANEYDELKIRFDYLSSQLEDLDSAKLALRRIDRAIDARMKEDFQKTYESVNANFQEIFQTLFPGGSGHLSLVDPDDMENTGVEVNAQPAGKRITKMSLMSGGEKSLVALALLFAVYKTRATPFYILDEVEAALDDTNLRRLSSYIDTLRNSTQLIMITHQRRTMEMADVLFGVSMQADGVTKVVSQKLDRALEYAE